MAIERARVLRARPTDAERKLWAILRYRQMDGHRFRRQAPIGHYIVDFVCFERKLVVEVDGGQHAVQLRRDSARTTWFRSQGFRIIRFWNNEALANIDGVGSVIRCALSEDSMP